MKRSARTLFLVVALIVVLGLVGYEMRAIADQREQVAATQAEAAKLDAEVTALLRKHQATQTDLTEAERQLAMLPRPAAGAITHDPAQVTARQAWFARVKQLQQIFAVEPARRIPEMQLLEESDWIVPAQFPFENEVQLRLALAAVREAARKRFRPAMAAAVGRYEAAGRATPADDILALAPYFDPPVDRAMLAQYEFTQQISFRQEKERRVPVSRLSVRTKAPVDEFFEFRPTFDAWRSGTWSIGSPTAWVPDYMAREQRAIAAYRTAKDPDVLQVDLVALAPYFDPPLPVPVVEAHQLFVREITRRR